MALVPFSMPSFPAAGLGTAGFQSQIADFNGDGTLDLIVAGSGANVLGYRQGVGDGSFLPEQSLNAGTGLSTQGIVAVDYDDDGDMDLVGLEYLQSGVTTVPDSGAVTLFSNNGSASFSRVVLKSGLPAGYEVVAGDLNGDGRSDLVYNKDESVAYALQQADGGLGTEVVLPAALNSISGIQLGDMDNDSDLDIVVGNRSNNPNAYFSVFSNDGNAVFGAPQNKTTGIFPEVQQLADLNGDGRLDVITGESESGSRAGYYPQLADGTFGSRVVVLPTNTQLNSIEVGDLDGDGILDIAAGAIVGGRFSVVWSPGLGGGAFGASILIDPNQGNAWSFHIADLDADTHPDILVTGTPSTTIPSAVQVYINKTGEDPMVLIPPAARTRVAGDPIDFSVYFGFPITVTGTPRIALDLGGNTVYAIYVSGSGTPTLNFRYTVTAVDLDLDGVQLVSNLIELNGGTLTDPMGGAGVLEFPNLPFSGVIVNGRGPLVQSITRIDSPSTTAGSVRFGVQFAEDVTDVDVSDFSVRMNAGDLAGAAVTGVTGSGSLYEVTVSTGTGSGTLGLSVNEGASISDLSGDVLAKGYAGGQVYTVRQQPVGSIDNYYVDGHADYRPVYNSGEFSYVWHGDTGVLPQTEYSSDEVITYIDSQALVSRPATSNYDFLGVAPGQAVYVNPSTQVVGTPFLGWSGDSLVANVFADYRPTEDPRITSATLREYVKVQMVGFRSDSGGDFSLYSGSAPTVWMATSDGIGSTDNFWLYRTHFHRNTAFSKPGRYEIDVVISGYLDGNANNALDASDVFVESGIKTMVFHVDTLGARDDVFQVTGQETLLGSVTRNDHWDDGIGAYTASVQTNPTKGTLNLQANGSFTYQPSEAFDGTDSFTYRLTNPRGGFTTATVTINAGEEPAFIAGLVTGHADIGIGFEMGDLEPHVHAHLEEEEEEGGEEHEHGGLEYAPNEVLIQVQSEGTQVVPNDPNYAFLGAAAGSTIYVLPTSPNPDLPFLGFGTEEIEAATFDDGIKLELISMSGPGHLSIWDIDVLGAPVVHMATSDGVSESDYLHLLEASHTHRNIGFSVPGDYAVTFRASAAIDGTPIVSEDVTYYFSVAEGRAPVITLAATPQTYVEQGAAKAIDGVALLTDADSLNFDGGQLRVDIPIGGQADDQLTIRNQGTGANQISLDGADVRIGATGGPIVIGTFEGGLLGEPLVVNLNSNATVARIQTLMRSIMFRNPSDNPTAEHRVVRFVVADGDGAISNATIREVMVTPVNDAPIVITSVGSETFTENMDPVFVDADITLTDADSPDLDTGRLTVSIAVNRKTTDRLTIVPQGDGPAEINVAGNTVLFEGAAIGTFTGGYTSSGPLVVSFNAAATPSAAQQLARRIAFANVSENPTTDVRTIRFQANDGDGKSSLLASRQVQVVVSNDAPTISNLGNTVSYTQNRPAITVAGSAKVTDPDSPNFDGGTLTVDLISGATAADVLGIRSQGAGNGRINVSGNTVTYGIGGVAVVIGTWTGGDGVNPLVIQFNSSASLVAVQATIRNITFSVVGNTPTTSRTVRFSLTDGDGGTSLDANKLINVVGN